jgi:hypothetical protein
LLVAALLLFALPSQASPDDPGGQGHQGAQGDNQTKDPGHGHDGQGHGEGNSTRDDGQSDAGERMNVTGRTNNGHPQLNITWQGHIRHSRGFTILRGVDGGNLTPYATVPASASTSYTDTSTAVGHVYSYAAENEHNDGSQGAHSQTFTTDSFGCGWIVVSPGEVLVHPECVPVAGPILQRIIHG